jgi:hypothetical protein
LFVFWFTRKNTNKPTQKTKGGKNYFRSKIGLHVEGRASLAPVKLIVAVNRCVRVVLAQVGNQFPQCLSLRGCSRVLWFHVLIAPAYIDHAYAVRVMASDVCAYLLNGSAILNRAVKLD